MGFDGKVVIVTGASTGIGEATAKLLAQRGARVVCAARSANTLNKTVDEIKSAGGQAIAVQADIAKENDIKRMVAKAVETYGRLDLAFNNAGYSPHAKIVNMEADDFDQTSNINFRGVFLSMKHEIPEMLKVGGGAIVNTASGAGHRGTPGISAYGATKWAVVGLSKSAALEYAEQNIRVNVMSPGPVWSVIGFAPHTVLPRFINALPTRFEVGEGTVVFNAVQVDIDPATGRALAIERIQRLVEA